MRLPIRLEVVLTPSEEMVRLRKDISALQEELGRLQQEYNRIELLYRSECVINMELQDLLRENGIAYRDAIKEYGRR